MHKTIKLNGIQIGQNKRFLLIAGPCVLEHYSLAYEIADYIKKLSQELDFDYIFKASYDKANRTSINSFRGPGLEKGLEILQKIKDHLNIPVISDIHSICEIENAAKILDIIQIPAFLCRQTDIIVEAAKTQKPVNIKKGQFLAPWDIPKVAEKAFSTGNEQVIITERGFSFGYNNLVVDFRGLKIMRDAGYPVIFDATHSVQLPGGAGDSSGGQRNFAPVLARAAVAAGVDGIFLEVYPEPDNARCDGPNSIKLDNLRTVLEELISINNVIKNQHI